MKATEAIAIWRGDGIDLTESDEPVIDALVAGVEAVLAIHVPERDLDGEWCQHDRRLWPCATARALGMDA